MARMTGISSLGKRRWRSFPTPVRAQGRGQVSLPQRGTFFPRKSHFIVYLVVKGAEIRVVPGEFWFWNL